MVRYESTLTRTRMFSTPRTTLRFRTPSLILQPVEVQVSHSRQTPESQRHQQYHHKVHKPNTVSGSDHDNGSDSNTGQQHELNSTLSDERSGYAKPTRSCAKSLSTDVSVSNAFECHRKHNKMPLTHSASPRSRIVPCKAYREPVGNADGRTDR